MYISVHAMHVAFIQVLAFKYFTTDSHFFKYLEFMMFLNSLCACLCVVVCATICWDIRAFCVFMLCVPLG